MPIPASEFIDFLHQYTSKDLKGWAFYVDTPNFKVYRRLSPRNRNLYEYRCVGGYPDIPANILSHVYLDLEYRRVWDRNMIEFTLLRPDTYWYLIKFPWPLSNRDYIYEIVRRRVPIPGASGDTEMAYVIIGDSVHDIERPPDKGIVRIDNYLQKIVIVPSEDKKGSNVLLDYFDDPKGTIPTSIINWCAKTGVPGFMKNLHDACITFARDFPDFVEDDDVVLSKEDA